MDLTNKWTVSSKVNFSVQNSMEIKMELKFFNKLCEMNEKWCKSNDLPPKNLIHPTTKKIVVGTIEGMIKLVEELGNFRPYRSSNSQ